MVEFCSENDFVITNIKSIHKEIHKITREVPGQERQEKVIIDYFLVNHNLLPRVKDVRFKRGAEVGSDHFLLIMRNKRNLIKGR